MGGHLGLYGDCPHSRFDPIRSETPCVEPYPRQQLEVSIIQGFLSFPCISIGWFDGVIDGWFGVRFVGFQPFPQFKKGRSYPAGIPDSLQGCFLYHVVGLERFVFDKTEAFEICYEEA